MTDRYPTSKFVRRHFSLMEMMAVLIIMGLLLAAVMGSFNTIAKGNNVSTAARTTSSQLFLARSHAISKRKHVAVVFATDKKAISTWLASYDGSNWVCDEMVPNTRWNQLAVGVEGSIDSGDETTVTGAVTSDAIPGTAAIVFKPNGSMISANDADVQVKSATVADNQLSMTVNWLTGRVSFPE